MCIRCSGKFSVIKLRLRRDLKKSNETNIWVSGGRGSPAKGTAGNKTLWGRSLLGLSEEQQGGQDVWSRVAKGGVTIAKIRDVGQMAKCPKATGMILTSVWARWKAFEGFYPWWCGWIFSRINCSCCVECKHTMRAEAGKPLRMTYCNNNLWQLSRQLQYPGSRWLWLETGRQH